MYPYPCSCSCRSTEFCCCYTPLSASIHVSLLCRPPAPPITVRVSRIVRSLSFSPFPGPSSLFTSATAGRLRQRQRQLTSDRPPPHHSGAPILPLLLFHYYYCTARSPSARTQPGSGERGAGLQQALISTGTHGTGTGTGTGVPPHAPCVFSGCRCWLAGSGSQLQATVTATQPTLSLSSSPSPLLALAG